MTMLRGVSAFWVLWAAGLAAAAAGSWTGTCVQVIDGDTVAVSRAGDAVTVRLAGIEAPELDQPFGKEARDYLEGLMLGQEVQVLSSARNEAGLTVAHVMVGELNASMEVLKAGLAWTDDTDDEGLILASIEGRGYRRGLWQDDNPVPPWEWRKERAGPPPTPVPVIRSLREVAKIVELKKNVDGKSVISGRPTEGATSSQDIERGPKGVVKAYFECREAELSGCADKEFAKVFREAYPGDSPGTFSAKIHDLGGGSRTVAISGTSAAGHAYDTGISCQCTTQECSCAVELLPRTDD